MPSFKRFQRMPETIRRFVVVRTSFYIRDAMITISERECPEACMSLENKPIRVLKFARIEAITDAESADGGNKYASGNRYPSYCSASFTKSEALIPGSAS